MIFMIHVCLSPHYVIEPMDFSGLVTYMETQSMLKRTFFLWSTQECSIGDQAYANSYKDYQNSFGLLYTVIEVFCDVHRKSQAGGESVNSV